MTRARIARACARETAPSLRLSLADWLRSSARLEFADAEADESKPDGDDRRVTLGALFPASEDRLSRWSA
jgi:hypothetical protein